MTPFRNRKWPNAQQKDRLIGRHTRAFQPTEGCAETLARAGRRMNVRAERQPCVIYHTALQAC
jgi:hypothetical protein